MNDISIGVFWFVHIESVFRTGFVLNRGWQLFIPINPVGYFRFWILHHFRFVQFQCFHLSFIIILQCIYCCLASYVSFGGIFKRLKFYYFQLFVRFVPLRFMFEEFTVLLRMFVQYSLLATIVRFVFQPIIIIIHFGAESSRKWIQQ